MTDGAGQISSQLHDNLELTQKNIGSMRKVIGDFLESLQTDAAERKK